MKLGLAIITYKRPEFLKRCLESLEKNSWGGATERIVVVDEPPGDSYTDFNIQVGYTNPSFYFQDNGGVAKAKNRALKELLARGCDHIFLMEDDQEMLDPNTCEKYIQYAQEHKLHHMNFAHHGPQKDRGWYMELRGTHCHADCVGAFSYYTKEVLEVVGLMDEEFYNAWEHVEHSYRIAKAGYSLPFWFFADHPQSRSMLREQEGSIQQSSIRPDAGWTEKMEAGKKYWTSKHGRFLPARPDLKVLSLGSDAPLRIIPYDRAD
jgi:GT2 family glycosyltransferase